MWLRLFLLSGLVAHKLLWELMKSGDAPAQVKDSPSNKPMMRLLKLTKLGVLGLLILQTLGLKVLPIRERSGGLRVAGVGLYTLGLATAMIGRFQLGNNWANLEDRHVKSGQTVVTHGIYRFIRHPIYIGDVLLVTGLQLALNSWLVIGAPVLFGVVTRQACKEEEGLRQAFPQYDEYVRQSKRFIPFVL